jgi:hypothetical protein
MPKYVLPTWLHWRSVSWSARLVLVASAALVSWVILASAWLFVSRQPLPKIDGSGGFILEFISYLRPHSLIALSWTQAVLAAVSCAACALAAWIAVRAWDVAANRQLAWLLLAAVQLLIANTLPYFLRLIHFQIEPVVTAVQTLNLCLAVFMLIGVARFMALFPDALDTDTVESSYLSKRPLLRAARRGANRFRIDALAAWHRALLSGTALWLACIPLLPCIASVWVPASSEDGSSFSWLLITVLALIGYFGFGLPFALASIAHWRHYGSEVQRRRVHFLHSTWLALLLLLATSVAIVPLLAWGVHASQPQRGALPPMFVALFSIFLMIVVFWLLFPAIAVLATAFAVFTRGSLDGRLAFTRVGLWSILGLLITALFLLAERAIAQFATGWLGARTDTGALIAGVLVTLSFMPLRRIVSAAMDRLAARFIPLDEIAQGERKQSRVRNVSVPLLCFTA